MKLLIKDINNIPTPANGYGYAFIDAADNKLKIKKTNSIIEYSNTLDDIQLLDLSDYSAFEVYPNDTIISAGTHPVLGEITTEIPVGMVEKFVIRTECSQENSDVVVDWGDGTYSNIKNGEYESKKDYQDEWPTVYYLVSHEYQESKKYTIKIFGKKYFNITHYLGYFIDPETNATYVYPETSEKYNLMCNCFTSETPIASHVTNLSSFAVGAKRLVNVIVDTTCNISKVSNLSSLLSLCTNLKRAIGFPNFTAQTVNANNVFYRDYVLQETDFKIPPQVSSMTYTFCDCYALTGDITKFFHDKLFTTLSLKCDYLFGNCRSLSGHLANKAGILWDSPVTTWVSTVNAVGGTNDEIRRGAPTTWTGYFSEDQILGNLNKRLSKIESRLLAIEESLT
jgi:hypothetical protein